MPINIRLRTVAVLLCALLLAITAHAADFGTKVAYKKDTPIQFTGFTLIYVGERRVASEKFPRGFLYYDFRVGSGHDMRVISWSAGTGEIAPLVFRAGTEQFALELKHSDKLGKLKDDELVVSRAP